MYQAPIVKKAFQILQLIAGEDRRMTISDLSRELGINKSTVHGIARALEEAGALQRDRESKRYALGQAIFELAKSGYVRIDMKEIARPAMEKLMRSTGQSVFLCFRSGNHVSIIDIVESTQDLKITSPIGTRVPLLAGALGKAFLASLDKGQALSLINNLGLRNFTINSITDPERYMDKVDEARENGYGLDDEEYIEGVRAVAAVINRPGQPMAAVWIVGFTPSMHSDKMKWIALATKRTAEEIARKIESQSLNRQKQ
jgi:IclR family KDG regulon transcriptional repressor